MRLPWRDVAVDGGQPVCTSLTADEAGELRTLAAGRMVLEVGSAYGYSSIITGQVAEHVFAADPHDGYGSMPDSLPIMRANLAAYDLADRVSIVVARSDSALAALREVGASFGLVFIDGDHREEGVLSDVTAAAALLAYGGVIACHDWDEETCPGVRAALESAPVDLMCSTGDVRVLDTLWIWES